MSFNSRWLRTKRSYTAEFTDASGLHSDADVRVRGVSVGKVKSVGLKRKHGQSLAAVMFYARQAIRRRGLPPGLPSNTRPLPACGTSIVVNPAERYSTADLVTHVPLAMTQPSYDITALFNGLQPVIATLSPDEINTFTSNAESYLSGDGGGLAPMLHSIRKLTEFVSDRQHVVATLMRNLSEVADSIGGHSKEMVRILEWVNRPLDGALKAIDEFRKSQLYGPAFTDAVLRLLANAGFPPVYNAARPLRLQAPPSAPKALFPATLTRPSIVHLPTLTTIRTRSSLFLSRGTISRSRPQTGPPCRVPGAASSCRRRWTSSSTGKR